MSDRRFFVLAALSAAALLASGGFLWRALVPRPAPSPPPLVTALLGGEDPARSPDNRPPANSGSRPTTARTRSSATSGGTSPATSGRRRAGASDTSSPFFRFALSPAPPDRRSRWATTQAYMAHFAVTDARATGSTTSSGPGATPSAWPGRPRARCRVGLDDWSAEGAESSTLPVRLRAAEGGASVGHRSSTPRGRSCPRETGGSAGKAPLRGTRRTTTR